MQWRRAGQHHLPHDLTRCQITNKTHGAGMAEAAVERAAHLTGSAKRPPVRVGDEYHFIILAVVRTQQPFARAVRGNLRFHDLRPSHDEPFGHPAPHWLRSEEHTSELQSLMRI